ncbi:nucleotidyltransferase family protein [Candidatus Magnetominusculus xianensis]|uniref:DNA polymerase III subunit beta n=1 Tax=Candidatus Magnetominusculus xianensis TaxID=1748249 RepID=A0ABR5SHU2_9BACT|nr:nucleotidyltransferase domain-containing protein [Candidatus Magnetominusculus xianensis]KWT91805.1 DNA polymerase III subunit beta [Candidatus Magnetominusculus xianensis]MBF0403861.1 nucleotidyltransferase domain-containing protein [Nitrospirota bacterium]
MQAIDQCPCRSNLPDWLSTIERLASEHLPAADILVYGSRINGTAHEGSDIDIVVRNPSADGKPFDDLYALREAISGSDIPVLVDVLDWARIPADFREEIQRCHKVLKRGNTADKQLKR